MKVSCRIITIFLIFFYKAVISFAYSDFGAPLRWAPGDNCPPALPSYATTYFIRMVYLITCYFNHAASHLIDGDVNINCFDSN